VGVACGPGQHHLKTTQKDPCTAHHQKYQGPCSEVGPAPCWTQSQEAGWWTRVASAAGCQATVHPSCPSSYPVAWPQDTARLGAAASSSPGTPAHCGPNMEALSRGLAPRGTHRWRANDC
jgi:hypothetical protein